MNLYLIAAEKEGEIIYFEVNGDAVAAFKKAENIKGANPDATVWIYKKMHGVVMDVTFRSVVPGSV